MNETRHRQQRDEFLSRLAAFVLMTVFVGVVGAAAGSISSAFFIVETEQVERGRNLFQMICAKCHGQQGEGGEGPRLIGTPNGLRGYETAQKLFDFVRSDMPFDNPGSLKPEEYWDVLAFILDANKLLPPDTILGPENAGNIRLSP